MKIQGKVVVSDIYHNPEKGEVRYYSVVDMTSGGQWSFSVDGALEGVKPGAVLDINADFKLTRNGQRMFVEFQQGTFKPAVI